MSLPLFHRVKNAAIRTLLDIPRGEVTPDVPTDLFQTVRAVHAFIASQLKATTIVVTGSGAGWAALEYQRYGRAVVLADARESVLARARAYGVAKTHLLGNDPLPQTVAGGVVAVHSPSVAKGETGWTELMRSLTARGELAVALSPADAPAFIAWAEGHFGETAVYDQLARGRAPDLASPLASDLRPENFDFLKRSGAAAPAAITTVVVARLPRLEAMACERVHVGSGPVVLPGWTNVDIAPYPGVHHVFDITEGLPFKDVRFIFAEHFIEHLRFADARAFLAGCRRALADDGVLRLSTPNLDWVLKTHYLPWRWSGERDALGDCFGLNRAFHGWGHQFLYSAVALRNVLHAAGFATVTEHAYGQSGHEELRELERHERAEDGPDLPHVLVMEATGRRTPDESLLQPWLGDYQAAIDAG